MPNAFLNSELSRNPPALTVERPGALLSHNNDDSVISYAEWERANRATYS